MGYYLELYKGRENINKHILIQHFLSLGLSVSEFGKDTLILAGGKDDSKYICSIDYYAGNVSKIDKPVFEIRISWGMSNNSFMALFDDLIILSEILKFKIVDPQINKEINRKNLQDIINKTEEDKIRVQKLIGKTKNNE